jgi:hypothetical protein
MTSEVIKGHLKISKSSFSAIYCLFNAQSFKIFFKNVNIFKTQIFHQRPSKIIKDHSFAKIFLAHTFMDRFWRKLVWMLKPRRHFHVMEKRTFVIFLLITTLTYVLMTSFVLVLIKTYWLVVPESRFSLQLVNTLYSIITDHLFVLSKKLGFD